ncbi:NfeD family protein, partial [Psychromonas sp.]|nr:NfeD family protein [Psychromonas sp.]
QNKVELKQIDNGMIGHQFMLAADLELGQTIIHHYSGINWQVRSKQALAVGTEVKIIKMDVGMLTVEAVD